MSTLETETSIDIQTDVVPYEDTDDGKHRRTHIINPPNNLHIWKIGMSSQDIVDIARMTGVMITALCGFKFVPSHNPDKYEACKDCFEIAQLLMAANGE